MIRREPTKNLRHLWSVSYLTTCLFTVNKWVYHWALNKYLKTRCTVIYSWKLQSGYKRKWNVIDSVKDSAASTQSIALILNPITDRDWYVTSLTYYCPNTSTLAPSIVIKLKTRFFHRNPQLIIVPLADTQLRKGAPARFSVRETSEGVRYQSLIVLPVVLRFANGCSYVDLFLFNFWHQRNTTSFPFAVKITGEEYF